MLTETIVLSPLFLPLGNVSLLGWHKGRTGPLSNAQVRWWKQTSKRAAGSGGTHGQGQDLGPWSPCGPSALSGHTAGA